MRFQAYHIIITVSFSRRSTFHCVFHLFYSILASVRPSPSLPPLDPLCPHRFRFLAAASLSFNFRFCMLFALSPSIIVPCCRRATPVVVSRIFSLHWIFGGGFLQRSSSIVESRFSKMGEIRAGVGTTSSVTRNEWKHLKNLHYRPRIAEEALSYSDFRDESEREGKRV